MTKKRNNSNVNELGTDSIRLNGTTISELPIAERAHAITQLPIAYDTERQNDVDAVLKRYPTQDLSAIQARIREAQASIEKISVMRGNQQEMINNYRNIVNMCKVRDKELSFYPDEPERSEKVREWNIQLANANTAAYMVYEDVSAFETQIEQCEEAIEKADDVLERERNDIRNMEKLTGQIIARDIELRRLGVVKKS